MGLGGGHVISKGIVIGPFNCEEQNGKILIGRFWERRGGEGAKLPFNIFGHLKRALELLISVRMSPLVTF